MGNGQWAMGNKFLVAQGRKLFSNLASPRLRLGYGGQAFTIDH
jgi:hypothetical protein